MPYIKSKLDRKIIDKWVREFQSGVPGNTGNLNYFLFKLAKESCSTYREYRDFIGELEAAKLEIYRRQIGPYEQEAIKRNGDIS